MAAPETVWEIDEAPSSTQEGVSHRLMSPGRIIYNPELQLLQREKMPITEKNGECMGGGGN